MQEIHQTIENEIKKLNEFINSTLKMLSKIVKNEISQEDLEVCWIQAIIDRALRDYPYTNANQKSLIEHKPGANFAFRGNDILLIYAFYNLIKNSFYQIEMNKKGKYILQPR